MPSLLTLSYTNNIEREIIAANHMEFYVLQCCYVSTGMHGLYNVNIVDDGLSVGLYMTLIIVFCETTLSTVQLV
jgi:hypothetical protein